MKTITLDEEAYARLKSWKRNSKDTFSSVVKQFVPVPGTMGALLRFLETQPAGDEEKDRILEGTFHERQTIKKDPWVACGDGYPKISSENFNTVIRDRK